MKNHFTLENAKYAGSLLVAGGTGYVLASITTYFANKFGVSPEAIALSAYAAKTVGFMGGNVVAYKFMHRGQEGLGEHLKTLTVSNSKAVAIDMPLKAGMHYALMANGVNSLAALIVAYGGVALIPATFKLRHDFKNGLFGNHSPTLDDIIEPANDTEDLSGRAHTGA
ncbi:hypothetical protein HN419_06890 [Candidatus Woesearchaeota archaeon]|jgi:hypothetical protein|nr:hypothetical protein [Candidatus Woesearchaeota archaeon]MBT3538219.1 hypothetical protein [Candidatus Woesearchaeota archaeon]MBT4696728.1 hypothetical protein [Candidatus Woesearchaeota archaeon]MBT4717236.1 hypothetical protein [Candidatus Woesearchaeota archaeon]MBT7105888.1 hypothetical protein [Candidatus Woesearchaeota archaeon]